MSWNGALVEAIVMELLREHDFLSSVDLYLKTRIRLRSKETGIALSFSNFTNVLDGLVIARAIYEAEGEYSLKPL